MDEFRKYLDPQTLARLHGLELRARSIVEGYVAGMHRSPFHGFSVEFAEHREYVPGDDLRYVDWKVFAKTDKVYLKQYEEETNLACYLLLDTSESMRYKSDQAALSKLEYAQCIAASLAHLTLRQQDSVGLVTFDQEIRTLLRPSGNPSQLKQMAHVMDETHAERKTATGPIFHDLAERLKKRGVVVILSDLFDDVPAMMAGLKTFASSPARSGDLSRARSGRIGLPLSADDVVQGLEQLPDVLSEPRALRKAYLAEFGAFVRSVQSGCRAQHIDYVQMRTDQMLDVPLSAYLSSRMKHAG